MFEYVCAKRLIIFLVIVYFVFFLSRDQWSLFPTCSIIFIIFFIIWLYHSISTEVCEYQYFDDEKL